MRNCLVSVLFVFIFSANASEYTIEEILPGVFVHLGAHEPMDANYSGDIGNSGFIVGNQAVAVIDPGGSDQIGRQLLQAIQSVTDLPVEHVVLTHFHPDHVMGATAFSHVPDIIAHKNYPRAIVQRGEFYAERFSSLFGDNDEKIFTAPTSLVGKEHSIDLGERTLIVNAYPTGHTDNDLTVIDLQTNTLWASDLVFERRIPSLDGSLTGWLHVLDELGKRKFDMVIPGHGKPGDWASIVLPQLNYLSELKRKVKKQIDQGLALSEVIKQSEESNDKQWVLFDEQHPANLTKAYTELEWD